jgi:hypothetical protein
MIEYMSSIELGDLLFQVIKSWQVIAVSIALILYMSLVGYAARAHHKPASVSKTRPKKKKKEKEAKEAGKSDPKKQADVEITQEESG